MDYSIKQDSERQKSLHSSSITISEELWSAYKPDHEQWRRLGINPNKKSKTEERLDPISPYKLEGNKMTNNRAGRKLLQL
jgi:hypothetical protein